MALVLPSTVLRLESFEGVGKLLAHNYQVEHIITTQYRSAFSESVLFREILLVAKKTKLYEKKNTIVTVLKSLPKTLTEARSTAELMKHIQKDYEDNTITTRIYKYSGLQLSTENWFRYIAVSDLSLVDLWDEIMAKRGSKFVSFKNYLSYVNGKIYEGLRASLIHAPIGSLFVHYDTSRIEKTSSRDRWIVKKLSGRVVVAEDTIIPRTVNIPRKSLAYGFRRI